MERLNPIYTLQRECHDCHKCIRECPVKAIRVQDTWARIVPEICVQCGNCVQVCPSHAKQVRDDLPLAKALLQSGRRVIASLAPSFIAQYPGVKPAQLIHAIRQLGFAEVSETALGAQQVSAAIYAEMSVAEKQLRISSACPVVVDLVAKYYPDCQPLVTSFLSPLLTHCRMLREHYGPEIAVVFIGPCIAKKQEAEAHPELLDVALNFEDLDLWFSELGIVPEEQPMLAEDRFQPQTAQEGALYPIDGGMAPGVTAGEEKNRPEFLSFSGMDAVVHVLKDIPHWQPEHNLFFELTACAGSCINGPRTRSKSSLARRRYDVMHYAQNADNLPRALTVDLRRNYEATPVEQPEYSDLQIQEALRTVGKYTAADILDCGGCGYESCHEFGRALITGKAERMMCATYTRHLAQKKAHALMQRMPSGVVIVDENMRILECNASFVRMFIGAGQQPGDLEGTALGTVIPSAHLFRRVLDGGEDIVGHDIRFLRRILNTSIFAIEPGSVIGGIFRDITEPTEQKEQIVARAREVIEKNLKTVQQIAYLLGENAADSEIILNSIVSSFRPGEPEEGEAH